MVVRHRDVSAGRHSPSCQVMSTQYFAGTFTSTYDASRGTPAGGSAQLGSPDACAVIATSAQHRPATTHTRDLMAGSAAAL